MAQRPRIFGMITTRASMRFTAQALRSLCAYSSITPADTIYLIDNDNCFPSESVKDLPVTLLTNEAPKSFAANANHYICLALNAGADLYLLNNDLVLTNGWCGDIALAPEGIASPLCNQQLPLECNGWTISRSMELTDYTGHEQELQNIARAHARNRNGLQRVLSLPFFCVRLSQSLLSTVGLLDERYGVGGAEDNDYCLRAVLAGFPIVYALRSYVLHFNGKSTWSGGEDAAQTAARVEGFRAAFEAKWGARLRRLIIDFDESVIKSSPQCTAAIAAGDLRSVVETLLALDGVAIPTVHLTSSTPA